jgi:hypothetical protein
MKKIIIVLLLVLTITVIPCHSKAAEQGTGLEVEKPQLYVYINDLSEDAKKFGLNKQLIKSKIELKLRQNDIEVPTLEFNDIELLKELNKLDKLYPYILEVDISFVGNVLFGAFNINLFFKRSAIYSNKDTNYKKNIISYHRGITGKTTNKNFIMNSLQDEIDIFINDFHKSNSF